MPAVELVFYQESDGSVPVLEWLGEMARRDRRIVAKCQQRMERLAEEGADLRRPEADFLRDGVHELRTRLGSVNFRILYSFAGREIVILTHALTKEQDVPGKDIDLAVERRRRFLADPDGHRYREDDDEEDE